MFRLTLLYDHAFSSVRILSFGQRQQYDEPVVCTTFLLLTIERVVTLVPFRMRFDIKIFRIF
jgi:hypothetical protein